MGWFLGRGGFYSLDNNCRRRRVEFTHRGCGMISLLLTVKLCCGFVCVICVWGLYPELIAHPHIWPHSALDFVTNFFFFFLLSLSQLYHVIWMNLHRDSPIWRRRRGLRKCLKMTQQQQAEFPVYGNSIGTNKTNVQFCSGLSAWQEADIQSWRDTWILINSWFFSKHLLKHSFFEPLLLVFYLWLFYLCFFMSVMVQTYTGLLFFSFTLNFMIFCFLQSFVFLS